MKREAVQMTDKHKKELSNTAKKTKAANITKTNTRGGYRF